MSGKIRLKRASGWFAAGTEWQRALRLLSDGAFKLFVYLSLQAERGTRRLSFQQRDLAHALGKSRRSIPTYLEELVEKRVCRMLSARNQYTTGVVEIRPEYWPYVADRASAVEEVSRNEESYVEAVGKMFLSQPCVRAAYSAADRRLARTWLDSGVSLTRVEQAILLGCDRKYVSWLNGQRSEPIGSLAYFTPLLEEISKFNLSLEYENFNRYQTEKHKQKWLAAARLQDRAGAKVSQAKAKRKAETR